MIRKVFIPCLVVLISGLSACSTSPEEKLLKKAFSSIQNNDWDSYAKLTITSIDFTLQRNSVTPLKARQSYTGSKLKPQERERHRVRFEDIQKEKEGFIDFANAEFVSVGSIVETGMYPVMIGGEVPYTAYSLIIQTDGEEIDTKELYPHFVVVTWNNEPRILYLSTDE